MTASKTKKTKPKSTNPAPSPSPSPAPPSSPPPPPPIERIHIGGLDPSKLPISEVASRLRTTPGIRVRNVDVVSNNRHYFFADIQLLDDPPKPKQNQKQQQQKQHAFDIVHSQYHNVTWKGCRLSIERARTSVLQKLKLERSERLHNTKTALQISLEPPASEKRTTSLPRILKIKRRYGEPAKWIDTHPRVFEDWNRLACHLRLLKKPPKEKDGKKEDGAERKKPKVYRATHVKFGDDGMVVSEAEEEEEDRAEDIVRTGSLEEEDGHPVSTRMEASRQQQRQTSHYIWSDDDEDDNSTNETSPPHKTSTPSDDTDSDAPPTIPDLTQDVQSNLNILARLFPDVDSTPKPIERERRYSEQNSAFPNTKQSKGMTTILQRYDPDDEMSALKYELKDTDKRRQQQSHDRNRIEKKEERIQQHNKNDEPKTTKTTIPETNTGPIYEQTKLEHIFRTAKQQPQSEFRISRFFPQMPEEDGSSPNQTTNRVNDEMTIEEEPKSIYEQTKLERIFRDAKQPKSEFKMSDLFRHRLVDGSKQDETNDDIKQNEPADGTKTNKGFAFSFSFANEPNVNETTKDDQFNISSPSKNTHSDTNQIMTTTKTPTARNRSYYNETSIYGTPRRKGFSFPHDVLDRLQVEFLTIRDEEENHRNGKKTMKFMDPWQEQRQALTRDWKRKHKNAMVQKKKKIRLR